MEHSLVYQIVPAARALYQGHQVELVAAITTTEVPAESNPSISVRS